MAKNPLGGSLHTQLVVLVMAVSVLSTAILAAISISISQQAIRKDVALRLNVMASDRMQALKSVWNLRLEQIESLASNENIRMFLAQSGVLADERLKTVIMDETLPEFESLVKGRDSTYVEVRIADAAGNVVIAKDSSIEGMTLSQDVIAEASRRPFYTTGFDDGRQIAVLMVVAPVHGPADSESSVTGYVILLRDLNLINRILSDKLFLGDTGEVYLVNENGLMITDSRFAKDARHAQLVDTPPVQECFRNGADVNGALYQNYRGVTVYGASSCDRNLGIVLVSEVASAELFAPLLMLQYQYLMITGAIVVAAGLASFFLSLSILKPLQKLKTTMGKVQDGRFEKVDIVRRDEIGELATSFNTMVEEIGIRSKRLHLKNDILSFMSSRLEVQADELKKADREKEEFSVMVSHELKTFLVPIIGYSELLLDGTLGEINESQKERVRVMLESAWSLLYLTQNILDARQLESGKLRMSISEPVSARALLEECVGRAMPLAKSRNLSLVFESNDIMFRCDYPRVLQVFDNLVSNAIKAVPQEKQNGTVRLSASKRDDHVLFAVRDNGAGILKDRQPGLFKKFYQMDKSLTRPAGGGGLGLAISKGIVEAHGGRIWFESQPGDGSTFYFTIPLLHKTG